MKRLALAALSTLSLTAAFTGTAAAADVRNHDDRPYLVRVVHMAEGATARELAIPSRGVAPWLCAGPCRIEVAGVGALETDGTLDVTVRDGRFFLAAKANTQTIAGR